MQNIRILTAGDSSLLIEFGKEISPEQQQKDFRYYPAYERTAYRRRSRYDPGILFFFSLIMIPASFLMMRSGNGCRLLSGWM